MKLSGSFLSDITGGVDSRTQSGNDSVIEVLGAIVPIVPMVRPGTVQSALGQTFNDSFITGNGLLQPASTGKATSNICTFGKGIWHVLITLTADFDFTTALTAVQSANIALTQNASTVTVLAQYARIGQFTSQLGFDMVVLNTVLVALVAEITGVAQNTRLWCTVVGEKLL